MSSSFQPLLPPGPGANAGAQNIFQKLSASVLPTVPAASPQNPAPVATSSAHPAPANQPQVSVDREGDRITRIQIRCSCGQVIELTCEY